jgi:integrase
MTVMKRVKEGNCSSKFQFEGQTYYFTFNGKKGMPLITDKKEAKNYEQDLMRQLKAGTFIASSPMENFRKFFEEVFIPYGKAHKSEQAQKFDEYYGKSLLAEFGGLRFSQITPGMIQRWLLKLSETKSKYNRPMSPVTVRMHFDRLNQTFNMAIAERITNDNPCRLVKKSILKNFPSWQPRQRWLNKYAEDEETRLFDELDGQLQTICKLLLNTGLRPPKEILLMEKAHINLSDKSMHYKFTERDGKHLVGQRVIVPPRAMLVVHGKDRSTRILPLNNPAYRLIEVLCSDVTTKDWLFLNREGTPMKSFKKGFAAACARAGIEDLRPYDLRHTFATRLQERYVHHYTISALLGHSQPVQGFGHESRITPGYSHTTWDGMMRAVESLEYEPADIIVFGSKSNKSRTNNGENEGENLIAEVG